MATTKQPCPKCDQLIPRDIAFCPYCGTKEPFFVRCPKCQAPATLPGQKVCQHCGTALPAK